MASDDRPGSEAMSYMLSSSPSAPARSMSLATRSHASLVMPFSDANTGMDTASFTRPMCST